MTSAFPEPYRRFVPRLGTFSVRPFDLEVDVETLHGWVTRPYAEYWGLLQASMADVRAEYERIAASEHHQAFLGEHDGRAAFLMERYLPAYDAVGQVYDVAPGDVGMHVLVGPPVVRLAGFTGAVFETIMDYLFSDPLVDRVVVEPDVRNTKIQALNARMGFRKHSIVSLPDKRAWLSFCTRDQYAEALRLNEAG